MHPYPDYIALIITILSIGSIIFYVNKKSVEQKGFGYAKALIEVAREYQRISVKRKKFDFVA